MRKNPISDVKEITNKAIEIEYKYMQKIIFKDVNNWSFTQRQ